MKVRFLCDVRHRATAKSAIVWKILEKFNAPENKDKVEIAYPHTELVFHEILTTVILPLAVPNIFTGLRLEAGMAWRVVIAAEMVAIPTGIGALMIRSESLLRMDVIIVCLMVLSVMCLAFKRFFQLMEKRLTYRWR
jgi:ABC-type proline/glycine betaine transport system permease subunit